MSAAATRAWYLPTWVNCATPVTSPIAHTSRAGRAQPLVDLDPARRGLDAELLETEPLDVRPAAGRDEQALGLERRAVGQVELDARLDPLDPDAEAHVDALLAEQLRDQLAGLGMDAPEQVLAALDDRHPRAHAGEELRELGADRAAAHDDEALRHLVRPRRVAVRPVLDRVEPVDRRDRRPRAGGEDEPVVRQLLPVHLHDTRPRDPAFAAHEPAAPLLEVVELAGVVPVARHPVAPRPDAVRLGPLAVQPRRPLERGAELGRPQQRLRRHAREVRALAADEPALDERDLRLVVEPAEGADEVLAGRPSAEDDDLHYCEPVRREEPVRDLLRRRLVHDVRLVHRLHRRKRQLRRDRVGGTGEQRSVRPREQASSAPARRSGSRRCACRRRAPCTCSSGAAAGRWRSRHLRSPCPGRAACRR